MPRMATQSMYDVSVVGGFAGPTYRSFRFLEPRREGPWPNALGTAKINYVVLRSTPKNHSGGSARTAFNDLQGQYYVLPKGA